MDILTRDLTQIGETSTRNGILDYIHPGDVVLHLACGDGRLTSEIARQVGPKGSVFGLESDPELLEKARSLPADSSVDGPELRFYLNDYLDLDVDMEQVNRYLGTCPIRSTADLQKFTAFQDDLRRQSPLHGRHLNVVIAEGIFAQVEADRRTSLLENLYHRLKRGGRLILTEQVSDEPLPPEVRNNGATPCVFQELELMRALEQAKFYGIHIVDFPGEPLLTADDGIEVRRIIVAGHKGKEGPCLERYQAVIYKGPWKSVTDDDGHTLPRGERIAVCDKTYSLYSKNPYMDDLILLPSASEVPLGLAGPFDCSHDVARNPRETKGLADAILPITIYTKQGCASCVKAKARLEEAGIRYIEVDVTDNNKGGQFHPFSDHKWPYRARQQQAASCDLISIQ